MEDRAALKQKILRVFTHPEFPGAKTRFNTPELIERAHVAGVLREEQLVDGRYYFGHCRDACVARWEQSSKRFFFMRTKFGLSFCDSLGTHRDDRGFDLFWAVEEVTPEPDEIVSEELLQRSLSDYAKFYRTEE